MRLRALPREGLRKFLPPAAPAKVAGDRNTDATAIVRRLFGAAVDPARPFAKRFAPLPAAMPVQAGKMPALPGKAPHASSIRGEASLAAVFSQSALAVLEIADVGHGHCNDGGFPRAGA